MMSHVGTNGERVLNEMGVVKRLVGRLSQLRLGTLISVLGGKRMFRCYPSIMKPHPDVTELAAAIRALEAHLRKHNAADWADSLAQAVGLIELSEAEGLYKFQRLFGGMGSLNDVVLHNEMPQFQKLLSRAWGLAQHLERSLLHL